MVAQRRIQLIDQLTARAGTRITIFRLCKPLQNTLLLCYHDGPIYTLSDSIPSTVTQERERGDH